MLLDAYFYTNIHNKLLFLCQLIQQILETTDSKLFLLTKEDYEYQNLLSDALWTNIPNSFLANEILNQKNLSQAKSPIVISSSQIWEELNYTYDILINLTLSKITTTHFKKIILLSSSDENELTILRQLYVYYKQLNYKIKHFDVSKFK